MSSNNHFVDKNRVERYNYYASEYNGVRNVKEHDDYKHSEDGYDESYHGKRRGCGRMILFILFIVIIIAMLLILSNKNTV